MKREEGKVGGRERKVEGLLITETLFSFIIKFNFDLNRRKREGGVMVRGGVESPPPSPCPWIYRKMIRL